MKLEASLLVLADLFFDLLLSSFGLSVLGVESLEFDVYFLQIALRSLNSGPVLLLLLLELLKVSVDRVQLFLLLLVVIATDFHDALVDLLKLVLDLRDLWLQRLELLLALGDGLLLLRHLLLIELGAPRERQHAPNRIFGSSTPFIRHFQIPH